MPNTVEVLRPDSTVTVGGWSTSGASLEAVTSDDSDVTYMLAAGATSAAGVLGFGTFSLPALAVVRSVQPKVRGVRGLAAATFLSFAVRDGLTGLVGPKLRVQLTDAITTFDGTASTSRPSGRGAWTQAALDAVTVWLQVRGTSVEGRAQEVYLEVAYNQAPTVTVDAPTGTVTNTDQPTVAVTYSDPEGDDLEELWVKVFDAATYGAGGFDPATSTAAWDSGPLTTSDPSVTVGVPLTDGTTYKAYAKAADAGSGERFGPWASGSAFTMAVDPPNSVVVTAPSADSATASITMGVRAYENVLTTNQADLETDTTGWAAGTNAAIARSTSQALHGAASLRLTASANGAMAANTSTGLAAVTPNEVWGAVASFKAAATSRDCRVDIRWRDSGSTIISTSVGVTVADGTGGFTESYCVDTAPANAAFADVIVNVAGASAAEQHYVDCIALRPSNLNLLTLNQATVETDLTGWENGANVAVVRSQAAALVYHGLNSLLMQAVTDGTMAARTPTATNGLPAREATAYTAIVHGRAVSAARNFNLLLRFYDASGVQIGVDGTYTSPSVANVPGGWTTTSFTAISPGGTRFVSLHVQVLLALGGERHVFDQISLSDAGGAEDGPGQVGWSRGGLTGKTVEVQRSDDAGASWQSVRLSVGSATAAPSSAPFGLNATQYRTVVVDHSAPANVTVRYRARMVALVGADAITGPWSYAMPAELALDAVWLHDTEAPASDMVVCDTMQAFTMTSTEPQQVLAALGDPDYDVNGDVARGEVFTFSAAFDTRAAYDNFETMRRSRHKLLLQMPDDQWYVRLGPDRSVTVLPADPATGERMRLVTVGARQVKAPA